MFAAIKRLFAYLLLCAVFLLLPLFAVQPNLREPAADPGGNAVEKTAYYQYHATKYDVLFLGDSRSYQGIDPSLIDPLLGTRSYNLAYYAHWLPTQLSQFRDLAATVPPNTIVVWSIGHINFMPSVAEIPAVYPINIASSAHYLGLGYSWSSIEHNVLYFAANYSPLGYLPGLLTYANRREWWLALRNSLGLEPSALRGGHEIALRGADEREPAANDLVTKYANDSNTAKVRVDRAGGKIISFTVLHKSGNSTRIELDPPFFRAMQERSANKIGPPPTTPFAPSKEYWATFVEALDVFRERGARLILNELDEAPYHYRDERWREYYRPFLTQLRSYAESRGIPYVRAPLERLSNADYLDYNHLNGEGVKKFSPLLAEALRPAIQKVARRDAVQ